MQVAQSCMCHHQSLPPLAAIPALLPSRKRLRTDRDVFNVSRLPVRRAFTDQPAQVDMEDPKV